MDIYAAVTDRIIAQMEQGVIPWQKPWVSNGKAVSHATGKPYSLLNQMLLGHPGEYLTFKQCQEAGGRVCKGEKAQIVVFWKWIEQEDSETGEKKDVPFLRYYNIFHIDQCEGIAAKYTQETTFPDGASTAEHAQEIIEAYLGRTGVKLLHQEGDRAFYRPSTDEIVLPIRKQFVSTAEYYSTVFHELAHSTGAPTRLNRLNSAAFFGNDEYSKEELVAEIASCVLVNHVGLETSTSLRNNAAYIQNWLNVLRGDKRFIVSAAGKAEKAVRFILGDSRVKQNLDLLLETAEAGSTLICTEVSRLSRSTQQLCGIVNIIKQKRMRLVIIGSITIDCRQGEIDPMSQAFIQMSAVFAELELSIIRARVKSGMANAREKGKRIGRRPTSKEDIPPLFYKHYPAYVAKRINVSEFARLCCLSRPTVYKYLKMIG